jgi:hypothetical protein
VELEAVVEELFPQVPELVVQGLLILVVVEVELLLALDKQVARE